VTSPTPSNEPPNGQSPAPNAPVLREGPEPSEKRAPVPFWLIILAAVIIFWAGIQLALNSGGFRADVYNPSLVSWSGVGSGGPAVAPDPKVIGKRLFSQNCAVCHQGTGMGVAGQFPPLVGSEWVVGGAWVGDNHLVKILLAGMQGPVQVKGNTYNNAMPPWAQLKDEQIASILTYIRSEWGNAAAPITADYVKTIRAASADRKDPWTQKELKAIPAETTSAGGAAPSAPAAPAPAAPPAA
jgi:mono/diheme cytochrome c family protein